MRPRTLLGCPPITNVYTLPAPLFSALGTLFENHGLKFSSHQKKGLKTRMVVMFQTPDKGYWTIKANVPYWKTDEEHDDLFYDAVEVELKKWIEARKGTEVGTIATALCKANVTEMIQEQYDRLLKTNLPGDFLFFMGFVTAFTRLGMIPGWREVEWCEKAEKVLKA